MAGASQTFHEDTEKLKPQTMEQHRAFVSLQEELEAVDWYNQRVDASENEELSAILAHNRDEEKEHAAMVLEWLRRNDAKLDEHLRTYLFTKGSLLEIEGEAEGRGNGGGDAGDGKDAGGGGKSDGSLGIGSLRGTGSLIVKEA
jgi:hypothetical protein